MKPDAIIVLSGGSVAEKNPYTGKTTYRSTTYDDDDAFGTLGGYARVQAAAILARKYPQAFLITTGKEGPDDISHAGIYASELEALGVSRERIILEESSVNTKKQIEESLYIAQTRNWKQVLFVTNQYQVERVQVFVEHLQKLSTCHIVYQDAESVLSGSNPEFSAEFSRVVQSKAYEQRCIAEARGVAAIKNGTYASAPSVDKLERST